MSGAELAGAVAGQLCSAFIGLLSSVEELDWAIFKCKNGGFLAHLVTFFQPGRKKLVKLERFESYTDLFMREVTKGDCIKPM